MDNMSLPGGVDRRSFVPTGIYKVNTLPFVTHLRPTYFCLFLFTAFRLTPSVFFFFYSRLSDCCSKQCSFLFSPTLCFFFSFNIICASVSELQSRNQGYPKEQSRDVASVAVGAQEGEDNSTLFGASFCCYSVFYAIPFLMPLYQDLAAITDKFSFYCLLDNLIALSLLLN